MPCRLADGLVERFVIRLGDAQSMTKRRNLAFCISRLSMSEKGVRKIIDNIRFALFSFYYNHRSFRSIKDSLYDNEIREYILMAIKCVRKSKMRDDSASASDELEAILDAYQRAADGADDGNTSDIETLIDRSRNPLELMKHPSKRTKTPKSAIKGGKFKRAKKSKGNNYDFDDVENVIPNSELKSTVKSMRKVPLKRMVNVPEFDKDEFA